MDQSEEKTKLKTSRLDVIRTVQTPLGFFVLVILIVEAVLGAVAVQSGENQALALYSMLFVVAGLVGVVAFFAYRRPEALGGGRPRSVEHPKVKSVSVDKVLCAVTTEFEKLGADEDVEILNRHFPGSVQVLRNVSSDQLREALLGNQFPIVHLLAYVEPKSGDFLFGNGESLSPEGLLKLLKLAGTRLAFLATCDSLVLGAKLARNISVVAATDNVMADAMIAWERCFYKLLATGHRLSEAYDVAYVTSDAPMILIMRHDSLFEHSGGSREPHIKAMKSGVE